MSTCSHETKRYVAESLNRRRNPGPSKVNVLYSPNVSLSDCGSATSRIGFIIDTEGDKERRPRSSLLSTLFQRFHSEPHLQALAGVSAMVQSHVPRLRDDDQHAALHHRLEATSNVAKGPNPKPVPNSDGSAAQIAKNPGRAA
jgi:hypothetical protein